MVSSNTRSHGALVGPRDSRSVTEILRDERRKGAAFERAAAAFRASLTKVTVSRTSEAPLAALSWASGGSGQCDVEALAVAKQGALGDSKLSRGRASVVAVALQSGAESSETEGARSFDAQEVTDERHGCLYTSRELDALTEQLAVIECDAHFRALRAVRRARARAQEIAHALAQLVLPFVELDAAAIDHPREGGV